VFSDYERVIRQDQIDVDYIPYDIELTLTKPYRQWHVNQIIGTVETKSRSTRQDETFNYSLIGSKSIDSAIMHREDTDQFYILNQNLIISSGSQKRVYFIRIKSTDPLGRSVEKEFELRSQWDPIVPGPYKHTIEEMSERSIKIIVVIVVLTTCALISLLVVAITMCWTPEVTPPEGDGPQERFNNLATKIWNCGKYLIKTVYRNSTVKLKKVGVRISRLVCCRKYYKIVDESVNLNQSTCEVPVTSNVFDVQNLKSKKGNFDGRIVKNKFRNFAVADEHVLGGDTQIESDIKIRPDRRPTQQELRRRAHMLELKMDDYEHFYVPEQQKSEIRKGIIPIRTLPTPPPSTPKILSPPTLHPNPTLQNITTDSTPTPTPPTTPSPLLQPPPNPLTLLNPQSPIFILEESTKSLSPSDSIGTEDSDSIGTEDSDCGEIEVGLGGGVG
jgi:hypothetical protein